MLQHQALFEATVEGGFVVTFPDFEWGVTQGNSEQEAQGMAADALSMVIGHCTAENRPLPVPHQRRCKGYRAVRLPALIAAKAELYRAFCAAGITKAELGRRLTIPRMNVDRLFDPKHSSRLDLIEAALHAFGKELDITVHSLVA